MSFLFKYYFCFFKIALKYTFLKQNNLCQSFNSTGETQNTRYSQQYRSDEDFCYFNLSGSQLMKTINSLFFFF